MLLDVQFQAARAAHLGPQGTFLQVKFHAFFFLFLRNAMGTFSGPQPPQ